MIEECRGCGHNFFEVLITPDKSFAIVKFKGSPDEKDDYSPLELIQCRGCGLVQLWDSVPPERLYSTFHYLSGINQSMNDALFDIVKEVEKTVVLKPNDIVVDIGANDGTLLSYYRRMVRPVGFEPALNILPRFYGFDPADWIQDYFSLGSYIQWALPKHDPRVTEIKKAKVVTAIAMFYDLEDPNKFLTDVKEILANDGIFILQMNDLDSMIQNISVDNICHEHLCYYSMDTLLPLLRRNNLYPISVSYNSVNGGSIRVTSNKTPNDKEFFTYKHNPHSKNISIEEMWAFFQKEKKKLLKYIKMNGKVWAYGASTRGNTLLQLLDLDSKNVVAIADRNPKKVGKFTAGGNIPIISEEDMRKEGPDNLLVLPYYFEKEFLSREIEYLKKGGRMLFPLPKFRIWTSDKQGNLKVHGLQ